MIKTIWIKNLNNKEYHFEIQQQKSRALSWESSGHWRSETGGYVTFDVFLNGDWDDFITEIYGDEVLIEMKQSMRALQI